MLEELNKDAVKSVMECDKLIENAKDGSERTRMMFEKMLRGLNLANNQQFSF